MHAEIPTRPDRIFRVFGLPRSGNHAIMDWLRRGSGLPGYCLLNNCRPGADPFLTATQIEIDGKVRNVAHRGGDRVSGLLARAPRGGLLLVSYEDALPWVGCDAATVSRGLPPGAVTHDIVIWRSFTNWLASLVQRYELKAARWQKPPLALADMVLDRLGQYRAGLLSWQDGGADGVVAILYDTWVDSPDYRRETLARLGLGTADPGLGDVAAYGKGSSFDGEGGPVDALRPDLRWERMSGHPDYAWFVSLMARDAEFVAALGTVFPEDARRLETLRAS